MAFFDKVSDLGKSVGKKSGEMIEETKTKLKINEEKSKIKEAHTELGKYYYDQYTSGAELDGKAAEICAKIKSMFDVIEELQKTRDEAEQKPETFQAQTSAGKFCPNCGAKQTGESKFCGNCGGKLEG